MVKLCLYVAVMVDHVDVVSSSCAVPLEDPNALSEVQLVVPTSAVPIYSNSSHTSASVKSAEPPFWETYTVKVLVPAAVIGA